MQTSYKQLEETERPESENCEEDLIEGNTIQTIIENFSSPEGLFTNILAAFDNLSNQSISNIMNELYDKNIISVLFNYVNENESFLEPFIKILKDCSECTKLDIFQVPDLFPFLISFVNSENQNFNLLADLAIIFGNYATISPKNASIITQNHVIEIFIQIFPHDIFQSDLFEDFKNFLIETLSFFHDMLNIRNFYPENDFPSLIEIGFSYIQSKEADICYHALELLINASSDQNYPHFEDFIIPNLDKYDYVLELTNIEDDEDISNLALQFLINTCSTENQSLKLKIFNQLKEKDLMTYLANSLDHYPNNYPQILQFISNCLDNNDEDDDQYDEEEDETINNYPIFEYFKDWIFEILLHFDDSEVDIKSKKALADLFSKMALIAHPSDIMDFIQDETFISKLCSMLFIKDDIDYDLLLALKRMLITSREYTFQGDSSCYDVLISKMSDEFNIEEMENMFENVEDELYFSIRDEVINLCLGKDEDEINFPVTSGASITFDPQNE